MQRDITLHVVSRNGAERAVCGLCLKSIHLSATYICPNEGCWHSAPVRVAAKDYGIPVAEVLLGAGPGKTGELEVTAARRTGGISLLGNNPGEDPILTDMMVVVIQLADKGYDELSDKQMALVQEYMQAKRS